MAMINITEKVVDILVNGNQEATFDQRNNSADYDVSVSSTGSVTDEDPSFTHDVTGASFFATDSGIVKEAAIELPSGGPSDWTLDFTVTCSKNELNVVYPSGNQTVTSGNSFSDTVNGSGGLSFYISDGSTSDAQGIVYDLNLSLTVNQTVSSSISVDNVTQS